MKFLAIEKELNPVPPEKKKTILAEEANAVIEMYLKNYLREIYFNEDHCAVLILECESKSAARSLLSGLPLVKENYIVFEITELRPYTGFSRLREHVNT